MPTETPFLHEMPAVAVDDVEGDVGRATAAATTASAARVAASAISETLFNMHSLLWDVPGLDAAAGRRFAAGLDPGCGP
jgi:hypothetical protein